MDYTEAIRMQNHSLIKRINECKVLNALRLGAPLSRSHIAWATNLDKKTVTNIVDRFIEGGLVVDSGQKKMTEGRPHELLVFAPDLLCAGISVEPDRVRGLVADFHGQAVKTATLRYESGSPAALIAQRTRQLLVQLREAAPSGFRGIGIVIPAVIDSLGRIVRAANFNGLDGCSSSFFLSMEETPVYFENSSKAEALAEKWFGAARDIDDFVVVNLGIGIGAGLVFQRRLYENRGSYTGEIGHTVIEVGGNPCSCGRLGCLEAYLSERVLRPEFGVPPDSPGGLESLPRSARTDALAEEKGYLLGKALAPIVAVLNPPTLFVNGSLTRFAPYFMNGVERGVRDHCLRECAERTRLVASTLADAAGLGALSLVLREFFEVPGHYYI